MQSPSSLMQIKHKEKYQQKISLNKNKLGRVQNNERYCEPRENCQNEMELHQLKYFRKVAQYESVSKAAVDLHVSQSALSRSIAKLEEELQVDLFDRLGKKLVLNEEGARFLVDVNRILGEIDSSVRAIGSPNNEFSDN